jgi:hypothetical protein
MLIEIPGKLIMAGPWFSIRQDIRQGSVELAVALDDLFHGKVCDTKTVCHPHRHGVVDRNRNAPAKGRC